MFKRVVKPPISATGIEKVNQETPHQARVMYRDKTGATSVTLTGFVEPNYARTTVSFEYGTDSDMSSFTTVSAVESPIAGGSSTSVSSTVSGLQSGTPYFFRIVASNSNGTTTGSIMSFTPYAPPIITAVGSSGGPITGGTTVTITGIHLTDTSSVLFGGTAGTSIINLSDTSVTVVTPAKSARTVDIVLTTPGGSTKYKNGFTYVDAPKIIRVAPSRGSAAGGTTVKISGKNLMDTSTVLFGNTPGTSLNVLSAESLTVLSPTNTAGNCDVVLITRGGPETSTDGFNYISVPMITDMTPWSGPNSGGTLVTITGTDLIGTTAVMFGDIAGTSVTVLNVNTVTVVSPRKTAELVDVVLTTLGGSATSLAKFKYIGEPKITDVTPSSGPILGDTKVTITGINLTGTSSVMFGGTAGTSIFNVSSRSVTVTAPAQSARAVDIVLKATGGSTKCNNGYTYVVAPTIKLIEPSTGPTAGGTTVKISGKSLMGTTAVTFDGIAVTSITHVSDRSVTVISPANAAGIVDVVLTTSGGSTTGIGGFIVLGIPTIVSVTPSSGPMSGGSIVSITGTNLSEILSLMFGETVVTSITVVNPNLITIIAPDHAIGHVDVKLTTPDGSITIPSGFSYVASPTITDEIASSGPMGGGTMVTITGTNLTNTKSVTFGGIAGNTVTNVSARSVTVITPANAEGICDVVLTTPGGSATWVAGFNYVSTPTITSVVPSSGPIGGGTMVAITGTTLTGTSSVMFGGIAANVISEVSAELVTVITPANAEGICDVVLTTPGGSATYVAGFHNVSTPTIMGVDPSSYQIGGGKMVTISGTNLTGTSSVMFGGIAGNTIVNVSATSVRVIPPANIVGTVDVAITCAGGATTATDAFTFSALPNIGASAASSIVEFAEIAEEDGITEVPTDKDFFVLSPSSEVVGEVRDTLVRRGRRAVASVLLLLLIVAAAGGYAVIAATRQANNLEPVNREIHSANDQVLQFAVASDLAIGSFLSSGDSSYIATFEQSRAHLVESIALLERQAARANDQGLSQMVNNSSAIVSTWLGTFADQTVLTASADTTLSDQLAGGQLLESLRAVNYNIMTYIEEVNTKAVTKAASVRRQTIAVAALVVFVSFMAVAVLLAKEATDVSYPLINMRRVVTRIYRGDRSTRADELMGPAEIRAVARAINELAYQQEASHKWVDEFNLAKTNFLNTINHELRTPLTSIAGYSEFLGDGNLLSESERNRMAKAINRNAFRLNELIHNMLIVLRIDSLQVQFKMSTLDIRDVIRKSVGSFRAVADSNEISIVSDLGDVPLMVRADANEILRVVDNLVSNAVKFSLPGGRIEIVAGHITSSGGKHEVIFSLKDSGIGIIEAELPYIGSRFYRSSNAMDAAIPGTGLGLMIVDFIVREHGGSWSLTSSELSGTTVEVRLPLTGDAILLDLTSEDSTTMN